MALALEIETLVGDHDCSVKARLLNALIQNLRFLQEQINKTFPQFGGTTKVYAMAHLLHPRYRGIILKGLKPSWFEASCAALINDHESTQKHYADLEVAKKKILKTKAAVDPQVDPLDALLLSQSYHSADSKDIVPPPPLEVELKDFFNIEVPSNTVDILEWWALKKEQLPKLADCAR
jgi:hypothetical protein